MTKMDIKKYIAKKRLLGARECNIIKYRAMMESNKKVEAYVYGNEAIYGIEITPDRMVYFIWKSDRELDIDAFIGLNEYNSKLYSISIEQRAKDLNICVSSMLFVFSSGNIIALNNYDNLHISYAVTDKYGTCIYVKTVVLENDIRSFLIDENLNKYECTAMGLGMSKKLEEYETIGINDTSSCKRKVEKIIKKLQRIECKSIEEVEVYEV